jgi:hypothetical protein
MLLRLLSIIFILTSSIKTEPSTDLIKATREKIAQINIAFLKNDYPETTSINEFGKLLNTLKQEKILSKTISANKDYENEKERLIDSYRTFKVFFQSKPKIDTLKKIFRVVNNEFNSLFGNYFLDDLKRSSKKRIILFSTSVSCECTLEMCYKQEAEIQKLQKENPDLFDYAVVDTWVNSELQQKHDVGFIPTILILDSKNKEVKRFEREENVNEIINYILNIN